MKDKDEVLLRCHRTMISFEKIVNTLKDANPKDLPGLVAGIKIDFDRIKSTINKALIS